jgi:hypothetical protein
MQYFEENNGFSIYGLSMKICGFVICGLAHLKHLQICKCGMSPRIYGLDADLKKMLLSQLCNTYVDRGWQA